MEIKKQCFGQKIQKRATRCGVLKPIQIDWNNIKIDAEKPRAICSWKIYQKSIPESAS